MLARRVLLLTLLCISLNAAAATAADWPCFLGANRDNTSADKNLKLWSGDSPKPLWKQKVGTGHSCMTVAGKRLYTQGEGAVWCLDSETGDLVWRYPPTGHGGENTSTPAVAGGLVFTLGNYHKILCLDAAKGELQWSQNVTDLGVKDGRWAISCSPLVVGNQVIMDLGVVFVLDTKTGKLVWKAGSDTAGFASAVVFGPTGQQRVTSFNGGGLAIYTLAKGEPVAKYKWATDYNIATPIVSEDKIFISGAGRGCSLLKLEQNAIEKVWENKEMNTVCQTAVLSSGCVYGVHGEEGNKGSIKCLDFETGALKWEEKGLKVGGGLTLADGKLFVMVDGGTLLVAEASPEAFKELARAKVLDGQCWTMPVVANGRIYCRNHDGELVCLDLR